MASGNMKDIKRRIKSVESTMQITKAMQLVASSKLRKAKEKAEKAQPFFQTLYETMCDISNSNKDFSSTFTAKRNIKNVTLIVVAGDRGLAGGFNSNILKPARKRAEKLIEEGKSVNIIAIGKKSVEFFEKHGFNVVHKYMGIGETITIYNSFTLANMIVDDYKKKNIDAVELYFTTFLSALTQEKRDISLLPIIPKKVEESGSIKELTEYEPSAEAVFDSIVPKYIAGLIFSAVVDSFAAEQASRRTAMESATDNASDMIDNLSLVYNRARQAAITQEITEIIGGSQM